MKRFHGLLRVRIAITILDAPFSSITFFLISSSPRVYKAFAVLDLILWVRPLTEEGGSVAKVFWMI